MKDPNDDKTEDWVDDTEDRRFREEQENARRSMRKKRVKEKRFVLQERNGRDATFMERRKRHQW